MLELSNIGADHALEATRRRCGSPNKVNRSVGVWGVHKQYVYRGYRLSSYAYVENGRVSGWQN